MFSFFRSICLLLQVAIPCLVYADGPTNLTLKGGTNADMAPQLDHMTMVFRPIAEKFGMKFDCRVIRRYGCCYNSSIVD